jgi:hypothetical protein
LYEGGQGYGYGRVTLKRELLTLVDTDLFKGWTNIGIFIEIKIHP